MTRSTSSLRLVRITIGVLDFARSPRIHNAFADMGVLGYQTIDLDTVMSADEEAAVAIDEQRRQEVAATIERALRFVPPERLYPCTNCGMAPLDRNLASAKLAALAAGTALVRGRAG